ncbi:DUF732 domain-containing protein [Mycobacterium servetii]|uniref:DUF732 domain-containing protein n=1 Tax=Mycobacterium servetii TaxID=3237418 RepID=A0ABV4C5D3_9MYCO
MTWATHAQLTLVRFLGVTTVLIALAGAVAAPIRADMLGNAFLSALTNAGIAYSQPATTLALGQSVCPSLFSPGGSFDSVVDRMAANTGMPYVIAGKFAIVAVATYCPAMMAPLLPNRLQS